MLKLIRHRIRKIGTSGIFGKYGDLVAQRFAATDAVVVSDLFRLECRIKPMRDGNIALLDEFDRFFNESVSEIVALTREANAHALARYAALCQEGGLVPIVEPEVLLDGSHTVERCQEVTEQTLKVTFTALFLQRIHLEGMILKPSMVVSGKDNPRQAGVAEVAERTLQCLKRTVPAAVPGIAFLSGGQSAESATEHLNAMNAMGPHPWQVSFSYARALQDPALKAWKGEAANVSAAQKIFYHRAKCNSAARRGSYNKQMEAAA